MNPLTKAFANSARSYFSCKASVSQKTDAILAQGPSGVVTAQPDLARAEEQYRHFKGWVYAAIRPIAQRIAGQPIHVGRRRSRLVGKKNADNVNELSSHPLIDLLQDPNDLMVSWSLIYSTVASLELTGRALWWMPERKQILPIPVSWIREISGSIRYSSFKVQPPTLAEAFDIPADECVYFTYPHPGDPRMAMAPLQAVAGAVDADEHITMSQVQAFRRGIHASHAILVGKNENKGVRPRLSANQQREIIGAIQKRYAGTVNAGEPLILDGLIEDIKRLSNTPSEMDWINSSGLTKERILQGFGVNGIVIGQVEGANRASSTEADRHFCDFTLNPKIELISQTLTSWCQWIFDDPSLIVWIEPCVPRDNDARRQWAALLAQNACLTGDELRSLSPFADDLSGRKFPHPVAGRQQPQQPEQESELDKQISSVLVQLKTAYEKLSEPDQMDAAVRHIVKGNGAAEPLADVEQLAVRTANQIDKLLEFVGKDDGVVEAIKTSNRQTEELLTYLKTTK